MVRLAGLGEFWGLQGGRLEKGIALAAATALEQHDLLSVFCDFSKHRVVFGAIGHRAQRHIDVGIIASRARKLVSASGHTVVGKHMLGVAQVEQGPELGVAAQNHIAAAPAVAAVGAAFRDVFLAAEVQRTRTALARAAENLHIINEIRGHIKCCYRALR